MEMTSSKENTGEKAGSGGVSLLEISIPFVLVIILCFTLGNCFIILQLQESQSQNKEHLELDGNG